MILCDHSVTVNYQDYGIMLPIAPDRGKRVLEFLRAEIDSREPGKRGGLTVLDFSAAKTFLRSNDADCLLTRKDFERIHCKDYIDALYGEGLEAALLKTFELIDAQGNPCRYEPDRAVRPLSDLFKTLTAQAGGTYLACLLALADTSHPAGFCYYLGGGMHHARHDCGSGFCLINDVAAAAFKLTAAKKAKLIWIIDMDAHKGDGTAELIQIARNGGKLQPAARINDDDKPRILALSIHMANGWPLDKESLAAAEKGRAPLIPSDVDIGIDSGEESDYTPRLTGGIKKLETLSGDSQTEQRPDFVIVVDGADPYEHDGLLSSALLRLTLEQCMERDTYVYRYLQERKIPSAWIQSGGYGDRAWEPAAHFLKNVILQ